MSSETQDKLSRRKFYRELLSQLGNLSAQVIRGDETILPSEKPATSSAEKKQIEDSLPENSLPRSRR